MLGIDDKTVRAIATLPTRHTWMAELMKQENLDETEELLDEWTENQVEEMFPKESQVARAVRVVLPFLMEKEAISQWVKKHPQWKGYLPEVEDAEEAASMAELELQTQNQSLHQKVKEALEMISSQPKPHLMPLSRT